MIIISLPMVHLRVMTLRKPGTGKTSTILAIARLIYGEETYRSHILELNASDDRGIDVVREQIKGFAQTRVLFR